MDALGLLGRSPSLPAMQALGAPIHRKFDAQRRVQHPLDGVSHTFALPITLTPFASARPCSARCRFCSETLVHRATTRLSATLRPGPGYFDAFERALRGLRGLPVGLSLSGLESTDDADWFTTVLAILSHWQDTSPVTERVLYSNGAGLAPSTTGRRLGAALAAFGLDRFEMSRHAADPDQNHLIMRFRKGVAVRNQGVWESAVRAASRIAPVRLVCVVQRGGVDSAAGVQRYLELADRLGVDDVVFRELSRLGDEYKPGATTRYVASARVGIEELLDGVLAGGPDWEPERITAGYYYWNLRLRWRGRVAVTFETSDYVEMKRRHASDVIYKLVFHGNGNLCGDWDPNTRVLLRAGDLVPLGARRA